MTFTDKDILTMATAVLSGFKPTLTTEEQTKIADKEINKQYIIDKYDFSLYSASLKSIKDVDSDIYKNIINNSTTVLKKYSKNEDASVEEKQLQQYKTDYVMPIYNKVLELLFA
jgi:hypothetical protein